MPTRFAVLREPLYSLDDIPIEGECKAGCRGIAMGVTPI